MAVETGQEFARSVAHRQKVDMNQRRGDSDLQMERFGMICLITGFCFGLGLGVAALIVSTREAQTESGKP